MRKKLGKLKIFILAFSLCLLFWILMALFAAYRIYRSNQKTVSITQISTMPPVDRYNRLYFAITKSNAWTEKNSRNLYSCEGILANTTEKTLRDWCIQLKVPDSTVIENTWNCNCYIEDNCLYIRDEDDFSGDIKLRDEASFGFLLSSQNPLVFRSAVISGRMCIGLSSSFLFILSCIMAPLSFLTALSAFILDRAITTHNIQTRQRKEHDNQIIEQTMKTFSNFIDNKDTYTQGHSTRVAAYVREMAKRMGMNEQDQLNYYYAGLMHDIGKLTIADEVLNKTSRLSTDEWNMIQQHTTNGAALLKNFTILPEINDAVLYHHERFDGTGYMNRLSGKDIPLVARMVGIADAFDAMNTNRCYRLKFSEERIISELERCRGKQFDPDLVPYLISMIKDGTVYKL